MIQKIKRAVITLSAILMPALALGVPATVGAQADIPGNVGQGTCLSTDPNACPTEDPGSGVNDLIADVINIFSLIVGVVAVIMIIVGGFRYITSGGNDTNVGAAKNTILYAIIGLVIVALAQFIVRFVLQKVTT